MPALTEPPGARPGSSWLLPAAVCFAFFLALAIRAGASDGFRFYGPIDASAKFAHSSQLLPGQRPVQGYGYDGQFAFYIAQDPLLRNPDTQASLGSAYRYRRILYPLLAWALALGRRGLLPYTLVLINLVSLTVACALAARFAARAGRSPWSVLAVAIYSGTWIPLLLDLTDPLHLVLLEAGVLAGSAGLLFLSALARETAAIALAVEAVTAALRRRWWEAARHTGAGVALGAWTFAVTLLVRQTAFGLPVGPVYLNPVGAPFILLAQSLQHDVGRFVATLPVVLMCLVMAAQPVLRRDTASWTAALYALVILGASMDTWVDGAGLFRLLGPPLVLSYLSWARTGDRLGWVLNLLAVLNGGLGLVAVLAPG